VIVNMHGRTTIKIYIYIYIYIYVFGPILHNFVEFNRLHRTTGLHIHKYLLRLALANGSDTWWKGNADEDCGAIGHGIYV
jgi:hypothetical protein